MTLTYTYTETVNPLELAILDATAGHKGQVDKAGEVYILHPLRVLFAVRDEGGSLDQQIAAVLHDLVEDQWPDWTIRGVERNYGPEIAKIVEALTRRTPQNGWKGYEPYEDYMARVVAAGPAACMVKEKDLQDNLFRIPVLVSMGMEDDAKRLSDKYHQGLRILWDARD